jgi:hypothetical protein
MTEVIQHFYHRSPRVEQSFFHNRLAQRLYKVVLILGVKDVDIDAYSASILLSYAIKGMFNESCFPDFPWGNECSIPPILKIGNQFFCLFCPVAEVLRSSISLVYKGVPRFKYIILCHHYYFTFGILLLVLHLLDDAKI